MCRALSTGGRRCPAHNPVARAARRARVKFLNPPAYRPRTVATPAEYAVIVAARNRSAASAERIAFYARRAREAADRREMMELAERRAAETARLARVLELERSADKTAERAALLEVLGCRQAAAFDNPRGNVEALRLMLRDPVLQPEVLKAMKAHPGHFAGELAMTPEDLRAQAFTLDTPQAERDAWMGAVINARDAASPRLHAIQTAAEALAEGRPRRFSMEPR